MIEMVSGFAHRHCPGTTIAVPLRTPDDHVVATIDGRRVLVDTGSPVTIGREARPLSVAGRTVVPVTLPQVFNFDHLSRLVGDIVDVVLGNDVLAHTSFEICLRPELGLVFAEQGESLGDARNEETVRIPFTRRATLPVCAARIGSAGELVQAVVDTGAVVSLAPAEWLRQNGGEPFAHRNEFYQSIGGWNEFDTPLWRVPVEIGGRCYDGIFAQTPGPLAGIMRLMVGSPFLLGTDLFRDEDVDAAVFDSDSSVIRLCLHYPKYNNPGPYERAVHLLP
jgi:hypothetical protein